MADPAVPGAINVGWENLTGLEIVGITAGSVSAQTILEAIALYVQVNRKQTITADSATTVIDWREGTYCRITLEADTNIVFDPPPPDYGVAIVTALIIQDGTGNHAVTYTPVTCGFAEIWYENTNQPLVAQTAGARTEFQWVLDAGDDELRIRQGVIGEQEIP